MCSASPCSAGEFRHPASVVMMSYDVCMIAHHMHPHVLLDVFPALYFRQGEAGTVIERDAIFEHIVQAKTSCAHLIIALVPCINQDTNIMQYEIIKRLKGADSNLFLVGDPNQAIYSWRGAVTEYLNSRFDKDFNHQTVFHHLEHNHRCV